MTPDIALVRGPDPAGRSSRYVVPPLGLLHVAGSLEASGWRVAVVDAEAEGLDDASFTRRLGALGAPVVGLSGMTPMRHRIAHTLTLARPLCERIVLGGVHATRAREQALAEWPELDALVVGEGEEVAPALLSWWSGGAQGHPPKGVMTRGQAFVEAAPPADLDALALPARHLVRGDRYRYLFQTRSGFTTLVSSRGCPFRCTFCDKTVSGSGWRARSADSVVAELDELHGRHGINYACFFDDNFTLRRDRVAAICEGILRRGLHLDWKCEARVDGVTPKLARLMARAGCRTVAFGVESGRQASLDALRKDQDLVGVRRALTACRDAGIETVGYVVVGVPGERPSDVQETLDFVRGAALDFIQFSTLSPFPGTDLYDQAVAEGWLHSSSVRNPVDAEPLRATLLAPGWGEDDLQRALRRLHAGFYLRPGYLGRQAWRSLRQGTLLRRARVGVDVARWTLAG